jgi:phage baseplate assembly protein W
MIPERDLLFGADLRLLERSASFDLIGDNLGDLALARGPDNIAQALTLRLLVRRGELDRLGWPDFGSRLHELIGEPNNQRTRVLAMAHARTAIEKDARVREVTGIRASIPPGDRSTIQLEIDIELITENTPVNLVFDVRLQG